MSEKENIVTKEVVKRGRKLKYQNDEERKAARRESSKRYREKQKSKKCEDTDSNKETVKVNKVLKRAKEINKALSE